jgi:LEA14-like dessication related protein
MVRTISILCGVVVLLGMAGCEAVKEMVMAKKPTADLKAMRFGDVSLEGAELLFDVELGNPYAVALPLVDMDYTVKTGGKQLASGAAKTATVIPAGESKVLTLPVNIKYMDLVKALGGVRPGSEVDYEAAVELGLDTPAFGRMQLPISRTGKVTVPTIPKAGDVDWKGLLDKATQ